MFFQTRVMVAMGVRVWVVVFELRRVGNVSHPEIDSKLKRSSYL